MLPIALPMLRLIKPHFDTAVLVKDCKGMKNLNFAGMLSWFWILQLASDKT